MAEDKDLNQEELKNEAVENEETKALDEEHPELEGDIEGQSEEKEEQPEEELSETEKLSRELAEQKDKFIRLYSEFENFRRRTAKEKIDLISTASEGLMKELIPVLDDFDRAMKSFEDATEVEPVKEGISLIQDKFQKTLAAKGLKPIEDAKGKEFDTEFHEAVTQFPAPSEDMKGKVIDQVEQGYMLGEKVIRYSKVVVGA